MLRQNEVLTGPDYAGLVRFLLLPLLEHGEALRIDCELLPTVNRVWVRVAFEEEEKGRVLGRHGRNLQAIRTVVMAAARGAGQVVHLELYNPHPTDDHGGESRRSSGPRRSGYRPSRRPME